MYSWTTSTQFDVPGGLLFVALKSLGEDKPIRFILKCKKLLIRKAIVLFSFYRSILEIVVGIYLRLLERERENSTQKKFYT